MPDLAVQRQQLRRKCDELVRTLLTLDTRRPQIRGCLYRHRIRCGRPGCHCADGPGHLRWCLAFPSPKARHTRSLSISEVERIAPGAEAYRRYRQGRARAAKLTREIFALVDRIQGALIKPIPGENGRSRRREGRAGRFGSAAASSEKE